jgi:hypothetical protein
LLSGSIFQLSDIDQGRQPIHRPVKPALIVVLQPGRDLIFGICQAEESMYIQALIPKATIKRLDVAIATHLTHRAGYAKTTAQAGAVTRIQNLGAALNLKAHFHMLFLDGVYINSAN